MTQFTPIASTLGGLLIGAAASMVLVVHGKVAGISGIYGGLFERNVPDRAFRFAFVAGLVLGGLALLLVRPSAFGDGAGLKIPHVAIAIAGLLVGFGTRLGSGCTSGHGVCGLSRFSPRSLIATITFMASGAATVWIVRHLGATS